ncbi:MAG: hypothetical protein ACE5HQ_07630 [Gemmatimonadota bacterium]
MSQESTDGRIAQLQLGVSAAAAAIPEAHAELARRAVAAARAIGTDAEAVKELERLHYSLVRLTVLRTEEDEAELVRELEALLPAPDVEAG